MPAWFILSYCFLIFRLLIGALVLARTNPQQFAYSAARSVSSSHLYIALGSHAKGIAKRHVPMKGEMHSAIRMA